MTLYLVRHGQTDGNHQRIVQTPDAPLSAVGHRQAQELADAFATIKLAQVLCSVHTRTRQSIMPLMHLRNCPVRYHELLTERNFGDLRGQAYDQIQADFFAHDYHPPNGETGEEFANRMQITWRFILANAQQVEGATLVMTHGLVLRALLSEQLGISGEQIQQAGFYNTCVTEIRLGGDIEVVRLCDTAHLSGMVQPGAAV